jgi:hypothetical protein
MTTAQRFRDVFNVVEQLIEQRWAIPVHIRDVPSPFTGDLDGAEIAIDYDNEVEDALFVLVHLFGHTVQWNTSVNARELGMRGPRNQWTQEQLDEVANYETNACRYSLELLHLADVRDLDQWLSDFAGCDADYLMYYYRTGNKRPFRSFWRHGRALLKPLAIPVFSPTAWISRLDGIVV